MHSIHFVFQVGHLQSSAQATARESRLQKKRDDEALRRATFKSNATPRDIEAQREYERNKKRKQLANETPQQREARLQRMRDYRARISSTEGRKDKSTPAVSSYTREYDRNQQRIQRERERLLSSGRRDFERPGSIRQPTSQRLHVNRKILFGRRWLL